MFYFDPSNLVPFQRPAIGTNNTFNNCCLLILVCLFLFLLVHLDNMSGSHVAPTMFISILALSKQDIKVTKNNNTV
jgi:hypothetical protein